MVRFMPNWVATVVEFDGKQENIDKVLAAIAGDKEHIEQAVFDFNKLIPMPDDFKGIESGSNSNLAYDYYMVKKV